MQRLANYFLGGGGNLLTKGNHLYRPYFGIVNIKNHIKGLYGQKGSMTSNGPSFGITWSIKFGPCDFQDYARPC